jgi:hypothetical protein
VTGAGQAAQPGPQLVSLSTWQEACAVGTGGGQRRAGALQENPQPPCTQAALALAGGEHGMQAPAHFRSDPWQT